MSVEPVEEAVPSAGREAFTYRRARSGSIIAVLAILIGVETATLHLLLWWIYPLLALALTTLSVAVLVWLVADYRAMGRDAFELRPGVLDLKIGRRLAAPVPRTAIASAVAPDPREIPRGRGDYLNATKPATPNVLVTLREPVPVRVVGGLRRSVRRIGLCLDEPERFIAALNVSAPQEGGRREG
jgi:hypothetical protein